MKTRNLPCSALALLAALSSHTQLSADDNSWYVRPYVGLSQLGDYSLDAEGLNNTDTSGKLNTDSGFNAGFSVGYNYGNNWSAELGWEYRSNDSSADFISGDSFDSGDYASNTFFINGIYQFEKEDSSPWSTYVGAGISWVQEIDIDLESNGVEQSFSGDGQTGFQVFAGVNYDISEDLVFQTELRYGSISDIKLKGENTSGILNKLDYDPVTLQIGLLYRF